MRWPRRYGIATQDITLLPIGGVARLQKMPDQPLEELVVAAAGPAVNVVIAAAIWLYLAMFEPQAPLHMGPPTDAYFLSSLMVTNIALVLFNLIPAFPMDGGRMLRALLALRMPYQRATHIAASIGQFLAIGFAFAGLFWVGNPLLLFVAIFVYLGAGAEARLTDVRMLLRGIPVREAMITRFQTLRPDDPLQRAVDELLAGWQTDFPVVENGALMGMLRRSDVVAALQERGPYVIVGELVTTNCPTLSHRDLLERVMQEFDAGACTTLPVLEGDRLVGLLTNENLGELMMLRSALQSRQPQELVGA
jgi:CBS domain-containing protein